MDEQLQQHYATESLNRMIRALPDDVHVCDEFLQLFHTESATRLDYKPILIPAEQILKYPLAVQYLCVKNPLFKQMYIRHYIENNRHFVRMTTLESFVLSILMHMYH